MAGSAKTRTIAKQMNGGIARMDVETVDQTENGKGFNEEKHQG